MSEAEIALRDRIAALETTLAAVLAELDRRGPGFIVALEGPLGQNSVLHPGEESSAAGPQFTHAARLLRWAREARDRP